MRLEEAQAVWLSVADSPLTLLFGQGWGATLESPAVGGIRVNYTHSILSGMLLKTGLAGLFLTVAYLAAIAVRLGRLAGSRPLLAGALAGPLLINIFFYASYKSLDFGLILLLIVAESAVCAPGNIASAGRVLYAGKAPKAV